MTTVPRVNGHSNANGLHSVNGTISGSTAVNGNMDMNGSYSVNGTTSGPTTVNGDPDSGPTINGNHAGGVNGVRRANQADPSATNGHVSSSSSMPIAICGIGVRLPGGVRSSFDLFDFLAAKGDARTTVPKERYNIDAYHHPAGKTGTISTPYGYFLNDIDLSQFDASMFRMSNAEVASLDPSQRLLLEVTREAFESAGEADFRGRNIGTFVGDFTVDWEDLQNHDLLYSVPYQLLGKTDFVLPNRLAYEYDLLGPSVLTKTACSATAEALHSAVLSIQAGSCPSAIVAGANIIMTPRASMGMTYMGLLSADGNCKTFDAKADGFARGESACALYIKRLDHAVRDGNAIRAVIRACDSNADGGDGSRTFGTPNHIAQEALIRQTYANAGLDMAETKVVELHGTGTAVGDPLEATAIGQCFGGGDKVYIGSVKPNLGHGEGGSAMASIIKSVMALENRTVLPNIKFEQPNPKIPWDRNLTVPTETLQWPPNTRERMSINSFGLGGSNVHIVLDSPAAVGLKQHGSGSASGSVFPGKAIFLLSGNSAASISKIAEGCAEYHRRNPSKRDSVVYTLAQRRERLKLASFCIVEDVDTSEPTPPTEFQAAQRVAFIFTGQGAQWVGMARAMMLENTDFAASIRQMDAVLRTLDHPPDFTLEGMLLADPADKSLFDPTDRSQPVCTAIQVAYTDALAAWQILPSAVVGHSSGEVAAAYAAGILTREEAIITAYYRGYACARNKMAGSMAAIGAGRDQVEPHLQQGVVLACENSNASVTISGDAEAVEATVTGLKQAIPNVFARLLRVPMGYHSFHMSSVAPLYESLISKHLSPKAPRIPYYSTVYGRQVSEGKLFGPQYWILNMESPVLFRTAVSLMLKDLGDSTVHLEVGPHSALAGPLRHIYQEAGCTAPYAAVAERGQDAARTFLQSMGKLYCFGIQFRVPVSEGAHTLPDLPTYPWTYEGSYWSENRVMTAYRFRKHRKHELLGLRAVESSDIEPAWRNLIKFGDVPWLADHRVDKDVVFPAAGYIAMAGAAVRQLTDSASFTVQEVHIASALLLNESRAHEVVTTLRKQPLTSTNDSKWWEFSISSESNGSWTKHCFGRVTAGCAVTCPPAQIQTHTRKISSKRWYRTLSRIGLNYGPRFAGLEDISASPSGNIADATVPNYVDGDESYALHPTTLDMVLQSWSVAAVNGEYRLLDSLFLPTFIESFYVGDASGQRIRACTTSEGPPGMAIGSSYGVSQDQVVYDLRGFRCTKMSVPSQVPADQRAWTIAWHPAIDLISPERLIRPARDATEDVRFIERFSVMCAAEIQLEAMTVSTYAQPHFKNFIDGVNRQIAHIDDWALMVPDARELIEMSRQDRQNEMARCRDRSVGMSFENILEILWRVCANINPILEGRESYLDIILAGGALQRFYNESNALSDIGDYFRVLGLNKPQLRVLEIGAGTGGTTARVLEGLQSADGVRLYGSYTITDVSGGFVSQCRERFSNYQNLEFAVLDITADPVDQGFVAGSYDLVVASNVLHATPSLHDTLSRCRWLLKPDGLLFMQELCSTTRNIDFVMGLFDGWWVGNEDGRVERPVISIEEWNQRLKKSGFQGVEAAIKDNTDPLLFASANILARPTLEQPPTDDNRRITLLKPKVQLSAFGEQIKKVLEHAGNDVDECTWSKDMTLPGGREIVSLMDVEPNLPPLLADISAEDLATLIQTLADISDQTVLWLMPLAQAQCSDPQSGQMLGAARCIRAEFAIDFVTVELETTDVKAGEAVSQLVDRVRSTQQLAIDDDLDLESEYVWRDSQMLISRIHSTSVEKALAERESQDTSKHLAISQLGLLQTMHWAGHTLGPLASTDVQVRVTHVGLNFHDVAVAMGIVDPESMEADGYHGLGCEGTGIVTAVGKDVNHLSVGDRVVVMSVLSAVFATEMQMDATLCVRVPEAIADEDAAAIVIPYLTVLWSLKEKAHIKKGQSLLIHSASGGVGIAAIHVARWLGAEFYCTVGAPAKVDFLVDSLHVPRERIFHSRDDSFVADVHRATGGKGVNVVLNSLSGELLHASWKCVAAGGCMVDLGKRDFLGRGRLSMHPFADNRSFVGVDLAALAISDPYILEPHLHELIELLRGGQIAPLLPTTIFDIDQVQDAFRYMQKGVHTGRIVIKMPTSPRELLTTSSNAARQTFQPDALYLLAGGMGGLGQSIITWMVSRGARNIMIISPSAGTRAEHREFVDEMWQLGCDLQCRQGDIADAKSLREVIQAADRPIRGVIQLAMALCDTGLINMDHASWTKTTRPKIPGTWNLHQVLPTDMDFFIMCSSLSGTVGGYGQSNYAASNAYLDAFVHYRHGLGLCASVLDIAAVGDVGYVASTKDVAERLERTIARFMTESDFLRCLEFAFERCSLRYVTPVAATATMAYVEPSHIVLHNEMTRTLSDPQNTSPWRRDRRISVFRNTQGASDGGEKLASEGLRSFLVAVASEPEETLNDPATTTLFVQEIAKRIAAFLMKDEGTAIDASHTLSSMGADSLVAIEIRNWWTQTFGVDVSVLELGDTGMTMQKLGELAVERLKEKYLTK